MSQEDSQSIPVPVTLYPPLNFSQVEASIYRSGAPTELNLPFLKTLQLKTVIALSHDCVDASLLRFLEEHSIKLVSIEDPVGHDASHLSTVSDDSITQSLHVLTNSAYLPALVICRTGRNLTGCVIGCLRKLQKWAMISIFEEYRRFAGSKMQQQYEQFIELYDTDLVCLLPNPPVFLTSTV